MKILYCSDVYNYENTLITENEAKDFFEKNEGFTVILKDSDLVIATIEFVDGNTFFLNLYDKNLNPIRSSDFYFLTSMDPQSFVLSTLIDRSFDIKGVILNAIAFHFSLSKSIEGLKIQKYAFCDEGIVKEGVRNQKQYRFHTITPIEDLKISKTLKFGEWNKILEQEIKIARFIHE
jgi:hypothetical protein